jgi:hypothetical protein
MADALAAFSASLPGLSRQVHLLRKMDARVKPAHDAS